MLYDLPSYPMEHFVGGCEFSFILIEALERYDSETCRENVSNVPASERVEVDCAKA